MFLYECKGGKEEAKDIGTNEQSLKDPVQEQDVCTDGDIAAQSVCWDIRRESQWQHTLLEMSLSAI